jgi:hypothetical protein
MATKKTKSKRSGNPNTPSFGVYLDDDVNQRYALAILEERGKLIKKGKSASGVTKSGIASELIEGWLKKKGY